VKRQLHRKVDTSVGVSGRHDFAVRDRRIRLVRRRVHRISCPTFCDDRETPLRRAGDARKNARDLPDVTSENACGELTRRANQLTSQSLLRRNVNAVIASVSRSNPENNNTGLLRRFAPLRKRLAFVAGNDERQVPSAANRLRTT
jgi:hypothetical protein